MCVQLNWPDQSLDELERVDWGEPTYSSYVVTNSHRLRKKPLRSYTIADMRFMLGQQISLPILMPLALDLLERSAFVDDDEPPGSLLNAALQVDAAFWQTHPKLYDRLMMVAAAIENIQRMLSEALLPAYQQFQAVSPWPKQSTAT